MKIIISNLTDGEYLYEFKEQPDFFGLDDFKTKDGLNIKVNLFISNVQIHAKINLSAECFFPCDRCLEEFDFKLENDFDVVFKFSKDEEELNSSNDENLYFIRPESNTIDLKEVVREYVLLSVPMRKVPEEKDGVCCFCKKNIEEILLKNKTQEISPVWNKLLNKI
jgi:uncharacterized metal-binding protein YceD (DUF177 family)